MSQLSLAMRAGFSARHVSFIETGRAQPSRQAVLVLAEALDVPLRERNRLLGAAGYAEVFRQTPLNAEEMHHVHGVLEFILERHEPYGAVVLDRHSNLLMANAPATRLLGGLVDSTLLGASPNMLRVVFHPLGVRRSIVNWQEVARHMWGRAERELAAPGGDEAGAALLEELRGYLDPALLTPMPPTARGADLLLPVHIRTDALELRVFTGIMTFGTPQDVTLQELRIETFFPADDASADVMKRIA